MWKMSEEHLTESEIFADKEVFRSTYIPYWSGDINGAACCRFGIGVGLFGIDNR